jgi:ketosteroid isomerase-like protein
MPEPPNVKIVRRGYAAFNNGDTSALAALIAENVVWHVPGRSLIAGDYHGGKRPSPTSIASTSSPMGPTRPSYTLPSATTST